MYDSQKLDIFLNQFGETKHQMLLEAYSSSLAEQREECKKALANSDVRKLYFLTHDIKSIALAIGAHDLGHTAQSIEKNAKNDNDKAALTDVPQLIDYIEDLKAVIDNALAKGR